MRKRGLFPAAAPRRGCRGYNPTHPGAKRAAFATAPAALPRRRPPCTRPRRKSRRHARPARPVGFGPVCPCAAAPTRRRGTARPRIRARHEPGVPAQTRRPVFPPRRRPSRAPPVPRRKPPPRPAPCARRKAAARAARGLAARPGACPPPQGSDRPAPGCARARMPRRLACAPKGGSNPRARFARDRGPLSRKFPRNSGPGV